MYIVTHIDIVNGEKTQLIPSDGLEFNTLQDINDYQKQLESKTGQTVYVSYKCKIEDHIPWEK